MLIVQYQATAHGPLDEHPPVAVFPDQHDTFVPLVQGDSAPPLFDATDERTSDAANVDLHVELQPVLSGTDGVADLEFVAAPADEGGSNLGWDAVPDPLAFLIPDEFSGIVPDDIVPLGGATAVVYGEVFVPPVPQSLEFLPGDLTAVVESPDDFPPMQDVSVSRIVRLYDDLRFLPAIASWMSTQPLALCVVDGRETGLRISVDTFLSQGCFVSLGVENISGLFRVVTGNLLYVLTGSAAGHVFSILDVDYGHPTYPLFISVGLSKEGLCDKTSFQELAKLEGECEGEVGHANATPYIHITIPPRAPESVAWFMGNVEGLPDFAGPLFATYDIRALDIYADGAESFDTYLDGLDSSEVVD